MVGHCARVLYQVLSQWHSRYHGVGGMDEAAVGKVVTCIFKAFLNCSLDGNILVSYRIVCAEFI